MDELTATYYTPGKKEVMSPSLFRRDGRPRILARARTPGAVFRQLFSAWGPALRGQDSATHWARIAIRRGR